ncbi:MAG TPA: hypothetical protein VF458_06385 [Ktedonobacteraceae bacterium]
MQQFLKRAQRATLAVAPAGHQHAWLKRRGSVGLFRCASCAASAVCPACLQSLDLALLVQRCVDQDISRVGLYWCSHHQVEVADRLQASREV